MNISHCHVCCICGVHVVKKHNLGDDEMQHNKQMQGDKPTYFRHISSFVMHIFLTFFSN